MSKSLFILILILIGEYIMGDKSGKSMQIASTP